MSATATTLTADEKVLALYRARARLLDRLAGHAVGHAGLDAHRREEIVDEVITWAAFDSPHPVGDEAELEALAWGAVRNFASRALEGRYDTVRGAYRRATDDELNALAADHGDPVQYAEEREESRLLLEFLRRLTPLGRRVFKVGYGSRSYHRRAQRVSYRRIAAELGESEKLVRRALRLVELKLDDYRRLIDGTDEFTRRALLALPAVTAAGPGQRPSGWRETLLDWLSRPFGHDTAATASTLAAGGGGRGIGTLAVAVCLGGTAAGGGYCVATGTIPFAPDPPKRTEPKRAAPAKPPAGASVPARAQLAAQRRVAAERQAAAQREAAERAARERAAARRAARQTASRRRRIIARRAAAQATPVPGSTADRREIQRDTRQAETAPASPAPPSSSGNDFDFEQTGPTQPAPPAAAPATGGGEFLP